MVCAMNACKRPTLTASSRKTNAKAKVRRPVQLQAHAQDMVYPSRANHMYISTNEMPIQMDPSHAHFSSSAAPPLVRFPDLAHLARPRWRTHLTVHAYARPPRGALSSWESAGCRYTRLGQAHAPRDRRHCVAAVTVIVGVNVT